MSSWYKIKPKLSEETISVLKSQGFSKPVPIQVETIPKFLSNKDVAVQAVTGSGKTLAFVVPIIEILRKRKEPWKYGETGCVVILPTRELAVQVSEVFRPFLPDNYSLSLLIGGSSVAMDTQRICTEGATIVVATPGRLADLLERKNCQLACFMKSLEILVLDEADRLLDLGFEPVINTILGYMPKQRRTGLFSATLTHEVSGLVRAGLRNPVNVSLDSEHNNNQECCAEDKLTTLIQFLFKHQSDKIIVFLATCASVSYFSKIIQCIHPSLDLLALHGKMRNKRQKLFDQFSEIKKGILICTDVMARGIDIPDVDWVIQYDPPSSAKSFIHRCGRTARMGRTGNALVFLLPSEAAYIQYMGVSQNVTLQALITADRDPRYDDLVDRIKQLLCRERELYDESVRAYVSFVRFYHKHELQLIFNLKDLDLIGLAKCFCLLHLPKMPELKGRDVSSFNPHPVSVEDIPFKVKSNEKKAELAKVKKHEAWSKRMHHRKDMLKKKHRKERRINRKTHRQKSHQFSAEELEDLAHDARLIKKFRAGKITKETLDTLLQEK